MYNIIKSVIESGRYELTDMLEKIDVIWIQGDITEEQKTELVALAQEKATPENSYAPLQEQINQAFEQIKELTATVNENAKGMSAIKEAVEKLGGTVTTPEPEPAEEYPEYVQPTGSHDAYKVGDKITYNGDHYECIMDNCVWNPVEYPQGWQKVAQEDKT